ncbi:hypothetical protein [Sphaerotilus sp.]|uniref:hypothetical protein n=1 Tax=Sphaerotilus sp. TaxID=2093942 RepID=UPI00286E3427|nr:hypothetical protein [Sphaerotilus sp.]
MLVSEFVNMVEARYGAPMAEAILFGTNVPDSHDEERLDLYPAPQLEVLFDVLSRRVGLPPCELLQSLAGRVISRIRLVNPDVFARHADLFGQIAASEDVLLDSYEIDEADVEEIELLVGERAAADCLVQGLLSDLARYERRSPTARLHRTRVALAHVRQLMR